MFSAEGKIFARGGFHLPHADSANAKQGRICAAVDERGALQDNEALAFPETFPQLPEAPEKNPLNAANCEELCIHRISGVGRNISRRNAETLVGNTAHCEKVCHPKKA